MKNNFMKKCDLINEKAELLGALFELEDQAEWFLKDLSAFSMSRELISVLKSRERMIYNRMEEKINRAKKISEELKHYSSNLKYKNHSPPTKIVNKGGEVGDGGLAEASLNLKIQSKVVNDG